MPSVVPEPGGQSARPVTSTLRALDLFCGAGGLSLGLRRAGVDVVAAIDHDWRHAETYALNHTGVDIRIADLGSPMGPMLDELTSLSVDIVAGGPPCQGFSMGGIRDADDPRNKLVLEFARIVIRLRPVAFIMENVEGLAQVMGRKVYCDLIAALDRSEYSHNRLLLDGADFGLPQSRRRTFIVGILRDHGSVDDVQANVEVAKDAALRATVWDAIRDLSIIDRSNSRADRFEGRLGSPSAYVRGLNSWRPSGLLRPHRGLGGCRPTDHSDAVRERFAGIKVGHRDPVSRFVRLDKRGVSPTLRAGTTCEKGSFMAPRPIHPVHHRCITVREAARIQSFPDWFEFYPTNWYGYMQVGNSVPPMLGEVVARAVTSAIRTGATADRGRLASTMSLPERPSDYDASPLAYEHLGIGREVPVVPQV